MKNDVTKIPTVKIVQTCPNCGNSNWFYTNDEDGAWECAACGDLVMPEDMCSNVVTVK